MNIILSVKKFFSDNVKRYFKYELKKNLLPMLVITVLITAFYVIQILNADFTVREYAIEGGGTYRNAPQSLVAIPIIILAILCVLIPIIMFSFKMSTKQTDLFYSLPIRREKVYFVKSVIGLIEVLIPFTIMFWLGFLITLGKSNEFYLIYFVPTYFLSVLFAILLFGFNAFVFSRANSIVDGVIFMALYAAILPLFVESIYNVIWTASSFYVRDRIDGSYFIPYSAIVMVAVRYNDLISNGVTSYTHEWVGYLVGIVCGVAGWVGLFLTVQKEKAENAERISDSWFGYKVLIPYFTCVLIMLPNFFSIAYLVVIPLVSIVCYIIFRRSVKLKKEDWIALGVSIAIGVIFNVIISSLAPEISIYGFLLI